MPLHTQLIQARAASLIVAGMLVGCSAAAPSSVAPGESAAPVSVSPAQSAAPTKIFQDADPRYAYGRYATWPVWSHDGSQIMFTLNPLADWFEHPTNGIYVINAHGTGLALVIGTPDFKGMAAWWP